MSVFARRLSIEQLRHAGVAIDPANFVIARRPLVYGFQTLAVGTPVPDFMPRHKIVQFHRMRRLDVAPNVTAGQATAPRFQRNAGDTPELGLTAAVTTPVPVAAVATVTPASTDDSFDDDGGFQLPEIDIPVAEMDDDIDAVVTRPVSIPVPVPVVQREPSQSSNHKSKHNRNHNR